MSPSFGVTGKKNICTYNYVYAYRITSRLINTDHFSEIFEVRRNASSGIPFLSLMQLRVTYLAGSKDPVKFLAGSGLISLRIKTGIVGGKTTILGTPNLSPVPTENVVSETGANSTGSSGDRSAATLFKHVHHGCD